MRHLPKFLVLAALLIAPAANAADQLVSFDEVITFTEKGNIPGETWHWKLNPSPSEPNSWTTPVDYSKGTVYIHQEVMSKPSARNTIVTICFDGDKSGYGCTDTNTYTNTGIHDTMRAMTSTWQYGAIAWSKRRSEYHLVIKDPGLGGTPGGKPATDFAPTTMRIVMTIVPPGGTYVPPAAMGGGMMMADGGATPPADAGSTPADAGVPAAADAAPAGKQDAAPADPTPVADAGSAPASKPDAKTSTPPADPGDEQPPAGGNKSAAKSGGCSFGGQPGAGAWLIVLGLVALQRRRRR